MRVLQNILAFLILALVAQSSIAQTTDNKSRFVFTNEPSVFIDGTSTVHDWTCDVKKYTGSFSSGAKGATTPLAIESGTFSVAIDDIDCGKGAMNSKMKDALGGNKATNVMFVLTSAKLVPTTGAAFSAELTGALKMAGVTKPIVLIATGQTLADNQVQIEGSVDVVMSDFDIDPPTAMLGMLKTGDKVTIRFNVVARPQ